MGSITVFGKPECGICNAAKDKLKRLHLDFEEKNIDNFLQPHEGWRKDNSYEVMAEYLLLGSKYPIIKIGDKYFDYPGAIKFLKKHKKEISFGG